MPSKTGKVNSFPLRLPMTMRREIEACAKNEGISINQLISLAVAEKIVRCEQQNDLNQAGEFNSSTLYKSSLGRVKVNALGFGASMKLESAQPDEHLIAMPTTRTKSTH